VNKQLKKCLKKGESRKETRYIGSAKVDFCGEEPSGSKETEGEGEKERKEKRSREAWKKVFCKPGGAKAQKKKERTKSVLGLKKGNQKEGSEELEGGN